METTFERLGVFGGTFNPPHKGHLKLVSLFADKLSLDRVLIVPSYIPPHKAARSLASCEDRLEMCRRAFCSDPRLEISTVETDRRGKSYTYDTLTQLKKLYPSSELFFIVGSDMLNSFRGWYRYEDILKMCTLCAAVRDDDDTLDRSIDCVTADIVPIEISSTEIREKISSGEDVREFLGEDVIEYIRERGLYVDR